MTKPSDLDWNDLRYALAAVRAKTLAGAARSLGVEHSTVGRRLVALEAALGAPLLTRGPEGLSLTAIGQTVAPLLEQMEQAALAVQAAVRSQTVRIKLATPSAFGRLLAPHIGAFQAARPEIVLEVLSGSRPADLRKGEADVALRSGTVDGDELIAKKIGELDWSLYASEAYLARHPAPAGSRDLRGHDLLGFEVGISNAPLARWLEERSEGARVLMRYREVSDLLAACVAGMGITILPCILASLEPSLRRLTGESLGKSRLSIVYRKEASLAEPVRAVIELVTEALRGHLGTSGRR
ncbi:LysR family transcriptional regulator [Sorangium sp. So ce693]|uniref:LysR family transcriptional regulator n=1 Tax=Sorangium sp. So ce693 TaxID=3133318 RepID=UPI003F63D660